MKIPEVAGRARRRLLWNEVLVQGMCAASVGLGAVVLLLLVGTQILDWRWLVALPVVTLALGTWRTLHRLPSPYAATQLVDRRLELADSLSTALYFETPEAASRGTAEIRQVQLAQAERMADGVDLARAIPFQMPRAIYAAGLLAFIAGSLFALRYGLERRLDLRPPLTSVLEQSFGGSQSQLASLQKKKSAAAKRAEYQDALGITTPDAEGKNAGELDGAPDSALDTIGVPDADNKKGMGEAAGKGKTPEGDQMEAEQSEGEASEEGEGNGSSPNSGEGKQGSQTKSGQPNAGEDPSGSAGNNSSLVSKLKDAMSNLLSRMKQQPPGAGQQQQSAANQNGQQSGQKGGGQKGKSGQGQKQQGGQDSDSQEGEKGEDGQNAQNAQGRGAGQSSDDQASKQPGSGIGKQDGDKNVKLAEQMAAMGKISEIIGKRNANVTGDVTVEVQSSSQQLKTAWVQQNAAHGSAAGEINRDEVPVELQPYVQKYFEQVRKQDAPAAAKTDAKSAPKH